MRNLLKVLLVWFVSVCFFSGVAIAANTYQEVDAGEVKALMEQEDALVVFPLSPIEFDDKHIKGSVNIPMSQLQSGLPNDKDRTIVFYCLGLECVASWRAAEKAVSLGYKNVYAFREGIPGWEKAGYPLVTVEPLPDVEIKRISTTDLAMSVNQKGLVLLDVNLETDANKFYIDFPGRVHIPLHQLKTSLNKLSKDSKIAVVCLKGKRSPTAARFLIGQGYKEVVVVEGGVKKWVLEGRPVKRSG